MKEGEFIPAGKVALRDRMARDAGAPLPKLDIQNVRKLIKRLMEQRRKHEELTAQLTEIVATMRMLQEETIPAAFDACGVTDLTLDDLSVSVKTEYHPGVLKEHESAFFAWLRKHDFDGIIKNAVTVTFGKGEDQKALDLAAKLLASRQKYVVATRQSVHANTLKAFVKEQVAKQEAGEKVPKFPPVLSVNPVRATIIKEKQ